MKYTTQMPSQKFIGKLGVTDYRYLVAVVRSLDFKNKQFIYTTHVFTKTYEGKEVELRFGREYLSLKGISFDGFPMAAPTRIDKVNLGAISLDNYVYYFLMRYKEELPARLREIEKILEEQILAKQEVLKMHEKSLSFLKKDV